MKVRGNGKSAGKAGRVRFDNTPLLTTNTFIVRADLILQVGLCFEEIIRGI
jgi:hypothetical protein